jgi:hypothetical protein
LASFADLDMCSQLTGEAARAAAQSAAGMRALLARFAEIARPDEGAPKIILAFARLCENAWYDGRLRVEISGDGRVTTIEVLAELGGGIVERLFPLTRLDVPFDEFVLAIDVAPDLMLPLGAADHQNRLVLTPLLSPEESCAAVTPSFELDDASLGDNERKTAPPTACAAAVPMTEPPPTPVVAVAPALLDADDPSPAARPTPLVPPDAAAIERARPRSDPRRED